MARCYISIGSNIDRDDNIPSSLRALDHHFGQLIISSLYESEAVGFNGDNFYNLVVGFDTELDVKCVAKILKQIELEHGRVRDSKKFSARTLDLDLLLYDDLIIEDGRLQIPRKEIEQYAFVLEPLAEIAPDSKHPISRLSYKELWQNLDKGNVKQTRIRPDWPLKQ
ncbi:MAG: 2-amino-4-hydroxy-6-hydroxymethyldihydropteridine diphosphokinase [Gammaproteobacteria bacterium]|jgi:2-amino-4-hydroxy-6-hydroxymethyldihydropteridine diphosphokinase|uniref:2-amino-4-hydroxy-6- hydroxymethyldihydropteridine diphosphokinase n=1 Tax=Methylotuvimicrobium sp. TaxID=2822413 RepID=UPI001D5ED769|nr:2-amino-4-hydroxy-6-hydroxymethyldihydropteridine diphosphokinase [Gammaproteobacteria bacterium]